MSWGLDHFLETSTKESRHINTWLWRSNYGRDLMMEKPPRQFFLRVESPVSPKVNLRYIPLKTLKYNGQIYKLTYFSFSPINRIKLKSKKGKFITSLGGRKKCKSFKALLRLLRTEPYPSDFERSYTWRIDSNNFIAITKIKANFS